MVLLHIQIKYIVFIYLFIQHENIEDLLYLFNNNKFNFCDFNYLYNGDIRRSLLKVILFTKI